MGSGTVSEIYSIGSVGRLIPLCIGIVGLLRALKEMSMVSVRLEQSWGSFSPSFRSRTQTIWEEYLGPAYRREESLYRAGKFITSFTGRVCQLG